MRRRFKIFRGNRLLGYAGFDDKWPCEPFEPDEAYDEISELFELETETSLLACELDRLGDHELAETLFIRADEILAQILEPGIRLQSLDQSGHSFECIGISIYNGRVCWR